LLVGIPANAGIRHDVDARIESGRVNTVAALYGVLACVLVRLDHVIAGDRVVGSVTLHSLAAIEGPTGATPLASSIATPFAATNKVIRLSFLLPLRNIICPIRWMERRERTYADTAPAG
jgi:hypothetical protein